MFLFILNLSIVNAHLHNTCLFSDNPFGYISAQSIAKTSFQKLDYVLNGCICAAIGMIAAKCVSHRRHRKHIGRIGAIVGILNQIVKCFKHAFIRPTNEYIFRNNETLHPELNKYIPWQKRQ